MGLQIGDLRDLVYEIFEVDSFASKMGNDADIVTLSFSVKEQSAAKDLMSFIENGYPFVLDADSTAGEQSDGTYKVFVEMERNKQVPGQIMEILDGVKSLTGKENFKFRYYKNFRSIDANNDTLEEMIPTHSSDYGIKVDETKLENYKNFFNKSYLESSDLIENTLILKKKYADPLHFKFIDFGNVKNVLENITETFDLMESYPEILFLTKYLGDYNISKYGDKIVFENNNNALVVKRIN